MVMGPQIVTAIFLVTSKRPVPNSLAMLVGVALTVAISTMVMESEARERRTIFGRMANTNASQVSSALRDVERKGQLHLPLITTKQDAEKYLRFNPEEVLCALYRLSPGSDQLRRERDEAKAVARA